MHRRIADEVANVRHHPILTGFDKPVLVKLGDVRLNQIHLFGDDLQQAPQGIALIGIAQPVDDWQEVIKTIGLRAHPLISVRMRVSGISGVRKTSSAGRTRLQGSAGSAVGSTCARSAFTKGFSLSAPASPASFSGLISSLTPSNTWTST